MAKEFHCPHCGRAVPLGRGVIGNHRIAGPAPGSKKNKAPICKMSGKNAGLPKSPPKPKKKAAKRRVSRACPEHNIPLVPARTQYGTRWACPALGCTVVLWGGSTSTPANEETRAARMEAHSHFDQLWERRGGMPRSRAYAKLREFMGVTGAECHIGMFDAEQCRQVVEFCEHHAAEQAAQSGETSNGHASR